MFITDCLFHVFHWHIRVQDPYVSKLNVGRKVTSLPLLALQLSGGYRILYVHIGPINPRTTISHISVTYIGKYNKPVSNRIGADPQGNKTAQYFGKDNAVYFQTLIQCSLPIPGGGVAIW